MRIDGMPRPGNAWCFVADNGHGGVDVVGVDVVATSPKYLDFSLSFLEEHSLHFIYCNFDLKISFYHFNFKVCL